MTARIIAVGSNDLIADEVLHITRRIVGNAVYLRSLLTSEITGSEDADLYVCGMTQKDVLESCVNPQKLCILDLRPTAEFFVEISYIPKGETIYIFNSNDMYAHMLADMCHEYHLDGYNFETIAYEEMPKDEVKKKLQNAHYIIGAGRIVDKEVLLSPQYAPYLRDDVTVIGRMRMATMPSAMNLIERVYALDEKSLKPDKLNQQIMNTLAGQFSDTLYATENNNDVLANPNDIIFSLKVKLSSSNHQE